MFQASPVSREVDVTVNGGRVSDDQVSVSTCQDVSLSTCQDVDLTPTEEKAPTPCPAPAPASSSSTSDSENDDIIITASHIKVQIVRIPLYT